MLKSIIVVVTYFFERFFNIFVQTWFQSCTPEYTNSLAFFPVQEVCLLSYYNKASDKIEVIWLGLTYCGKASKLVAEGLKLSLDLWFGG